MDRAYNIHMLKHYATLLTTPNGVLWTKRGRYYKTMQGAKLAVKRDAKQIVKSPASKVLTYLEME